MTLIADVGRPVVCSPFTTPARPRAALWSPRRCTPRSLRDGRTACLCQRLARGCPPFVPAGLRPAIRSSAPIPGNFCAPPERGLAAAPLERPLLWPCKRPGPLPPTLPGRRPAQRRATLWGSVPRADGGIPAGALTRGCPSSTFTAPSGHPLLPLPVVHVLPSPLLFRSPRRPPRQATPDTTSPRRGIPFCTAAGEPEPRPVATSPPPTPGRDRAGRRVSC